MLGLVERAETAAETPLVTRRVASSSERASSGEAITLPRRLFPLLEKGVDFLEDEGVTSSYAQLAKLIIGLPIFLQILLLLAAQWNLKLRMWLRYRTPATTQFSDTLQTALPNEATHIYASSDDEELLVAIVEYVLAETSVSPTPTADEPITRPTYPRALPSYFEAVQPKSVVEKLFGRGGKRIILRDPALEELQKNYSRGAVRLPVIEVGKRRYIFVSKKWHRAQVPVQRLFKGCGAVTSTWSRCLSVTPTLYGLNRFDVEAPDLVLAVIENVSWDGLLSGRYACVTSSNQCFKLNVLSRSFCHVKK